MHPYIYLFLCVLGTIGFSFSVYQTWRVTMDQSVHGAVYRKQFRTALFNMTPYLGWVLSYNIVLRAFASLYLLNQGLHYFVALIFIDFVGPYVFMIAYVIRRKANKNLVP